jgi:hypothetical protein
MDMAMAQDTISGISAGTYSLYAFGATALVLFLAFLYVFNFTAFF